MIIDGVEIDDVLVEKLVPGARVRYSRGKGDRAAELRHIRAVVDRSNIVYRVWWPHHRRWEYKVEWIYSFQLEFKYGWLQFLKGKDTP